MKNCTLKIIPLFFVVFDNTFCGKAIFHKDATDAFWSLENIDKFKKWMENSHQGWLPSEIAARAMCLWSGLLLCKWLHTFNYTRKC